MRIVFVNSSCQREGGVETYLHTVMPAVKHSGHEISLCHELDSPSERGRIGLLPGAPSWCVAELGLERTLAAVRQWRPDVIYTHNVASVELELELLNIGPAVRFVHAYYGTCISGSKTFKKPVAEPCHRRFGWQCLLHFYPRRCGGMNPLTMLALYDTQRNRLAALQRYRAVLTHSEYMRTEYIRNGVAADRVFSFPYCVEPLGSQAGELSPVKKEIRKNDEVWRLVFAGRMDELKGGSILLDALPLVQSASGRPLQMVFAGDGPERRQWENAAAALHRSHPDIQIEFAGWRAGADLAALFRSCHLLVVPSVWPEPFGVVGVEAALEGIPAAAFAVGGIPTWLIDGVTGHLAPGDPPTAEGLARAITNCLSDGEHYSNLCRGAAKMAGRFTVQAHVVELIRHLESASHTA